MMAAASTTALRGELLIDAPLARLTTWHVGGTARQLYRPADADDLAVFLSGLPADEKLLWIGLGSNLLVRDGGFDGSVIVLQGGLSDISIDGQSLYAGAGATCARVARQSARANLTGAAFLAGIPGTMGGALAMNAGAFGGETWASVAAVTTINRQGRIQRRKPGDFAVGYRRVKGPQDEWFIACELALQSGDAGAERAAIKTLLEKRAATQPTGQRSAGSTFKNPEGDFAARLIEACGLKGYRIGGAHVSEKHANFLITEAGATAADVEQLIGHMHDEVMRRHAVKLQVEVHVVGEST